MKNNFLVDFQARINEIDDSVTQDFCLPVTRGLMLVYTYRTDLQKNFPLNTQEGRRGLLFWWLDSGIREYPFLKCTSHDPEISIQQDVFLPITQGLMLVYTVRTDLQKVFSLNTYEGRYGLVFWWLQHGILEYHFLKLTDEQKKILLKADDRVIQDQQTPLPKILIEYYFKNSPLQEMFDIDTMSGRKKLLDWWLLNSELIFPSLTINQVINEAVVSPSNDVQLQTNGINIVGFARGELGIGEDVRMAAKSMESAKIPFSVYDVPLRLESRTQSTELESKIQSQPIYRANLICLPGTETFLLAGNSKVDCFSQHYNIGAWQWELPHWPKKWDLCLDLVDEIWAFSHYAENMFREATDKPVIYMPICVEYPLVEALSREKFNLPENTFLFLSMFDCRSSLTRKNPLAVLYAFLKAFPTNPQVALVVKAMHGSNENSEWQKITEIASRDNRIYILNETFSHAEVMGLIQMCDAYVSLHRAEGFGRILAEALLLKKPVITTNFSGNTDFTNSSTAFMVNGPMIPLKHGDYAAWEDQYWCEPDIDEAAKQMMLCFENPALREKLARCGRDYIRTIYSSKAVGEKYRARLKELSLIV